MRSSIFAIAIAVLSTLPWLFVRQSGIVLTPVEQSFLSGLAIVGAAFLLSWAAETLENDVPRSVSLAFVALIAVLPEYAVDLYFTWQAGKAPESEYVHYAVANMTGANRLLIGIGWSLVFFLAILWKNKNSSKFVVLDRNLNLEIGFLALATIFAFTLPMRGEIALFDSAVFIAIYIAYMLLAMKSEGEEAELQGVPAYLSTFNPAKRRASVLALFIYAGLVILLSVEAFSEGLVESARHLGIDAFLVVQWIAPLASESPELIVATYLIKRGRASASINALISSKLNQWTLLIGTIPIVFSISLGSPAALPLDQRQTEEVLLTAAQSLFAIAVILNRKVNLAEAFMLLFLFGIQFFIPGIKSRIVLSAVYIAAGVLLLIVRRKYIGEIAEYILRKKTE